MDDKLQKLSALDFYKFAFGAREREREREEKRREEKQSEGLKK